MCVKLHFGCSGCGKRDWVLVSLSDPQFYYRMISMKADTSSHWEEAQNPITRWAQKGNNPFVVCARLWQRVKKSFANILIASISWEFAATIEIMATMVWKRAGGQATHDEPPCLMKNAQIFFSLNNRVIWNSSWNCGLRSMALKTRRFEQEHVFLWHSVFVIPLENER